MQIVGRLERTYRLFWILTCFILTKRNDIRVVIVNEAWKGTGLAQTHADLIVVPTTRVTVLLQTHQASAGNTHSGKTKKNEIK